MIKSMTGYGNLNIVKDHVNIDIEIKSINSKNLDIYINCPKVLTAHEIKWRNIISKYLSRGKINLNINLNYNNHEMLSVEEFPQENFINNYNFLNALKKEVKDETQDIFNVAFSFTLNKLKKENQNIINEEYIKIIDHNIEKAIQKCDESRIDEGKYLEKKILEYISLVNDKLTGIKNIAPQRIEKIKSKIVEKLKIYFEKDYDENRLEQELIYYIEKLDIEEEIVRLEKHIMNFIDIVKSQESTIGKKLVFIIQEILREANTISSKSSEIKIQNNIIIIKENIEKIKEQLYNII